MIDYESIRREPTYPWIKFVDAYSAKILSMRPVKEGGKDYWLMKLSPTDELTKQYKLKSNEPYLEKAFPVNTVFQLSNDPSWTEYFCIYTWDCQPTPVTDLFLGTGYVKKIDEYKEEIERLKSKLAGMSRRLELAESNIPKYIKENFGTIMETMGPAMMNMILSQQNNPNMPFQPVPQN
jgi:hypothetical protein